MTLQHQTRQAASVRALVDVQLVLEKLGAEQTRIGEWVNVVGYITSVPTRAGKSATHEGPSVHVQALLLWSAGPLDVQKYERSVEALQTQRASPYDHSRSSSMAQTRE